MKKQALTVALLTALLASALAATLLTNSAKANFTPASHAIIIRSDGEVGPDVNPFQITGNTYTLTADLISNATYYTLDVRCNNIMLDGGGYTIRGYGSDPCIVINACTNVTIQNFEVSGYDSGIEVRSSSKIAVLRNRVDLCATGVFLGYSVNCKIIDNNLTKNYHRGIQIFNSNSSFLSKNSLDTDPDGVVAIIGSDTDFLKTALMRGFQIGSSFNNTMTENSVANSKIPIRLSLSSNNTFYRNNFYPVLSDQNFDAYFDSEYPAAVPSFNN
jgi:parallel beta-helix repeat protein